MARKKKVTPLAERLKSTMVDAFRRQREFTREFESNFPVIQKELIRLAEVTAGQSIGVESLAIIVQDLNTILVSFRSLAEKAETSITEASIATMKLKELEDEPKAITEALVDQAQILANADIWMQADEDFIAQVLEFALPGPRRAAIGKLTMTKLDDWFFDIVDETEKRP